MHAFIRNRKYTGPIQAAVLDWAGTTVDYGCLGPVAVFVQVFAEQGVAVDWQEARRPMGLMKRDHVAAMCADPDVAAKWREAKGREPNEEDVEAMYRRTEPLMVGCIAEHSDPIPGVVEAVAELRRLGLKIGSSTGYTRPMLEVLAPEAARKGYVPDAIFSSTDVPRGRPYPWMCFKNAIALETYPLEGMVKIGDTVSDIQEGLNAGMWTIGLTRCGNELGLTKEQADAMDPAEMAARLDDIHLKFRNAGAHYTAESLSGCPTIIEDINQRLARGETPGPR